MTVFHNKSLSKLQDPALLVEIAQAVHEEATLLIARDEIPKYYLNTEVYVPGIEVKTPAGRSYHEISHYSDGFGASLFVMGDQMLFISSNHETIPELAYSNREVYLTPLFDGLSQVWDFLKETIATEERFKMNPPGGIFWFKEGEWHITSRYNEIVRATVGSELYDYRDTFDQVDEADLNCLFAHDGLTKVDATLVTKHFTDWKF